MCPRTEGPLSFQWGIIHPQPTRAFYTPSQHRYFLLFCLVKVLYFLVFCPNPISISTPKSLKESPERNRARGIYFILKKNFSGPLVQKETKEGEKKQQNMENKNKTLVSRPTTRRLQNCLEIGCNFQIYNKLFGTSGIFSYRRCGEKIGVCSSGSASRKVLMFSTLAVLAQLVPKQSVA